MIADIYITNSYTDITNSYTSSATVEISTTTTGEITTGEIEHSEMYEEVTEIIEIGYIDTVLEVIEIMDPEAARIMLCNETNSCHEYSIIMEDWVL